MNFPLDTPSQAKAVLRSLRQSQGLSQAEVGHLLGVSQKRIARIEAAPEKTSFDQLAKLIALLGGRIVVEGKSSARTVTPDDSTGNW